MQIIGISNTNDRRSIRPAVSFLFLFLPLFSFSQMNKLDIKSQRLLLQLGAGYLNVAKQNAIDLDSGLALAARRTHLNPMVVMGENYDDIIGDPQNNWVAAENISGAKIMALRSKGLKRIQLLNLIGSFYVFQPADRKIDLDSSLLYLTKARKEVEMTGDVKTLCQTLTLLGKCYLGTGDLALADKTFNEAIGLATRSGNKREQAMALMYWAAYSPFQMNTLTDRINHLKAAQALFDETGDKGNQIVSLTDQGYMIYVTGNLEASKQSFLRALSLEREIGFPFTHYTNDLLSLIQFAAGNNEGQLRYAMDALKTAEATKDSAALAYFYARMSNADLGFIRDSTEGLEWGLKAIAEFERLGDGTDVWRITNSVVRVYEEMKRNKESIILLEDLLKKYPTANPIDQQIAYLDLGYAYNAVGNIPMAEKYYMEAEKVQPETEKIRGTLGAAVLYYHLAEFYYSIHRYDKSKRYYQEALKYPNDNNDPRFRIEREKELADIDFAEGKFKSGYSHLRKYIIYYDSLMEIANSKQVSELRIQYETEKKDNNIKILSQQGKIQEAQIRQDRITRNLIIAGVGVLLLFLGLLYNQYRNKLKTNLQLETQQKEINLKNTALQHLVEEKEFLMKEIHHRVKNNLQIVISLLNTQSKFLDNAEAIAAISESRHRMQAMSLIHQKLYQSENVAFVGMPAYIRELVDYLDMSFNARQRIKFELKIDPIDLDISQAIPVGLILNEAVTNCIKHAFTDQQNGIIHVDMKALPDRMIFLEISDNGKGLPADFDFVTSQSLGIRLIRGLVEQIGGELNFSDRNGCRISTTFKQDLVLKQIVA